MKSKIRAKYEAAEKLANDALAAHTSARRNGHTLAEITAARHAEQEACDRLWELSEEWRKLEERQSTPNRKASA